MEIAILALIMIWQSSTLLEYEQADGALVSVPAQVGTPWLGAGAQYDVVEGLTPLQDIKNTGLVRQHFDYSCGSAALTTILNYFLGLELDEQRVMNGMLIYGQKEKIIARRGFSLADMKRFIAALGFKSGGFRGEISDLQELTQPAILRITYGDFKHFVVLREIRGERVYIADPAFGKITLTLEEFRKLWDNILFLVYADEDRRIDALALSDEDMAFIDEDLAFNITNHEWPAFNHQLDRNVNAAAEHRLTFNPH